MQRSVGTLNVATVLSGLLHRAKVQLILQICLICLNQCHLKGCFGEVVMV